MLMFAHTSTQRLGDEKHVRDLIERVRVDHGLILLVDTARSQLCATVNITISIHNGVLGTNPQTIRSMSHYQDHRSATR